MSTHRQAGFTLIEIMIVVALIGVLAAIAIPGFRGAIAKTQSRACAANRKNIDGVKMQWALEYKKSGTAVPTESDLFGESAYIERRPDCPGGGTYSFNAVQEKCGCSIATHAN